MELWIFSFIQFIVIFIKTIKEFYKVIEVVFENLDKKIIVYHYI